MIKSEKQKMLSGELYNAADKELTKDRLNARLIIKELNDLGEDKEEERNEFLTKLIPNKGENLFIQTPFYCDYGSNIVIGEDVYFNFNCVVLDVMKVTIGSRTLIGPNVQIYTATHQINYKERATGLEYAMAINIGNDVWIGGSAIINPGVKIGDRTVIGAGSVVTKNIPSDVFAAGNPCRVIKNID